MDYSSIFENIFSSLFSDVDKAPQIKSFWIHSDIMDSKYVDLNLYPIKFNYQSTYHAGSLGS